MEKNTPSNSLNTPIFGENPKSGDWVDLKRLDPRFGLDIRYSSRNNFIGRIFYPSAEAFLWAPVAHALHRAHLELWDQGYGILIFDAYRPFSVTQAFWNECKPGEQDYLADPARGSNHNRGCAVDLSLYSRDTGKLVEMTSDFDEMNEKAWPTYTGGSEAARSNRDRLILAMSRQEFEVAGNEWWHFNHPLARTVPVWDLSFEKLRDLIG